MPDPETELRSDALRVEEEARRLQRQVRPVMRKAGGVVCRLTPGCAGRHDRARARKESR